MEQAAAGRQAVLFAGLWMFIIVVSAIDGFLVWQHRQQILNTELNPWGRFLILANGGDVWFMLAVKFIGTVVANFDFAVNLLGAQFQNVRGARIERRGRHPY